MVEIATPFQRDDFTINKNKGNKPIVLVTPFLLLCFPISPTLFALPSFGGVGGGSLSTRKKPTLFALPSLWEGLGVGFKGQR